jgi:hypothetical protein
MKGAKMENVFLGILIFLGLSFAYIVTRKQLWEEIGDLIG